MFQRRVGMVERSVGGESSGLAQEKGSDSSGLVQQGSLKGSSTW